MVAIGDKVTKVSGGPFVNEKQEEIPLESSLRFLGGFLVRQEIDGMKGYGHPPENFWTVVLTMRHGKVGLLLPEGDEEYRYRTIEKGKVVEKVAQIHHEPTFVDLSMVRYASSAEVVALPT